MKLKLYLLNSQITTSFKNFQDFEKKIIDQSAHFYRAALKSSTERLFLGERGQVVLVKEAVRYSSI